jgi:hypothetical protein
MERYLTSKPDRYIFGLSKGIIMKVILIVVGILAGIYAIFGVVQFVGRLLTSDPTRAYGTAGIAASAVPVCVGLIVCLTCFMSAFRRPKP